MPKKQQKQIPLVIWIIVYAALSGFLYAIMKVVSDDKEFLIFGVPFSQHFFLYDFVMTFFLIYLIGQHLQKPKKKGGKSN